jgi:ABC-type uncharacterized transport system involved in gliding motility auxiliary subunit
VTAFFSFLVPFRFLAVIFGLISILLSALVRFFLPEISSAALHLLILGLVLIFISALGSLSEIKTFLGSKQGRYSTNTAIMVGVFIAIIVLLNLAGITRYKRLDLTASSKFTLAPQTQRVIQELKQPVEAIGFFPNDSQYQAVQRGAQNLLEEYRYFNRKFSFRFVDPDAKPAVAKQYRVKANGTIVFLSGERQRALAGASEQGFTGALLEVTGVEAKKIYFLSGHGERDVNNLREDGYTVASVGLIRDLYKVETLNLTLTPEVPDDCAVLVISGPKNAIPEAEAKAVYNYLKNHGKVLALLDPNPPDEIQAVLAEWGIRAGQGHIIDNAAYVAPDKATPAVFRDKYPPLLITAGLDTSYYPDATSVVLTDQLTRVLEAQMETQKDQQNPDIKRWPLAPAQYQHLVVLPAVLTTPTSWLETDPKVEEYEQDKDTPGPLAIAVQVIASAPLNEESPTETSRQTKLTRIIVIGDSDFASNKHIQNGGNGDLFLNSVNWLAEEQHLISIRPKPYTFRRLVVSDDASRFIRFSSLALLPFLVILVGVIVWYRKR